MCVQEWLQVDKQIAMIALGRFKSCVRSTLLLCDGYECCEKEGTFTAAFHSPRAALEWALTLQLALLRWLTQLADCILTFAANTVDNAAHNAA